MYQFKVAYYEIKPYPLRLGDMLKDFTIYYLKKIKVEWITILFYRNDRGDKKCSNKF